MIGAVTTTITCKRCGLSFETEATSNTRCRSFRTVGTRASCCQEREGLWGAGAATRGKEPAAMVLVSALDRGHVSGYFEEGIRAAEADDYLGVCEECGSTDREDRGVLGTLSEEEPDRMSDGRPPRVVLVRRRVARAG